jgi:hypothetical protein
LVATGSGIRKGSQARNAEGDYASTGASVDNGFVISYDEAEAILDKATASEVLVATGSGIEKGSYAGNAEGDYASTRASVDSGLVVSYDNAEAILDKAAASEVLVATGSGIEKGSYAGNAEGDYASTGASVDNGFLVSYDNAEAILDKAAASEVLAATGSGIEKGSYAGNAEGDYASTRASVDNGFVISYDEAEAVIDKATASEVLVATGSGIRKGSQAGNAEGDYASTRASVDNGFLVSYDNAEAIIDKATASEVLVATGSGIRKGSQAWNAEGDYASTRASVDNGFLVSYDNAEAIIDKATASEVLTANGSGIRKGSQAWNAEGDYASTRASVDNGFLVSYDNAEAVIDKATASEVLVATGSRIWKDSQARNAEGDYASTRASVDNGLVVSYGNAEAIIDKATASEVLVATGSGIRKGSQAWNAEGDYASTRASVDNGLVVSYDNAEAILDKATASEDLIAVGTGIYGGSQAWNAEGEKAATRTSVGNGMMMSFDDAEAKKHKTVVSTGTIASGDWIEKVSDTENGRGDTAGTAIRVDGDAFMATYDDVSATDIQTSVTTVSTATGDEIAKSTVARTPEGDMAGTSLYVDGDAFMATYDDVSATDIQTSVTTVSTATGDEIAKNTEAKMAGGNTASTSITVNEDAFMATYDDVLATNTQTSVTTVSTATGDEIAKNTEAKMAGGNTAGTSITVKEDAFMATYADVLATNTQTSVTTVSIASGDEIAKNTEAKTAGGDTAGTSLAVEEDAFMATYDDVLATNTQTSVSTVSVASGDEIAKNTEAKTAGGDTAGTSLTVEEDAFMATYDDVLATNTQTSVTTVSAASGGKINTGGGSATNSRGDSSTYASVEDGTLLIFRSATSTAEMTEAMQMIQAEGDLIKAGGISHSPNGYARNDVEVSNGGLTAGIGTLQMPLPDYHYVKKYSWPNIIKKVELKVTDIDIAAAAMYMQTDSCNSVKATAEAHNIHSGTASDQYTGSGTVTKSSIADLIHLYYKLDIYRRWPFSDKHYAGYIDEQDAEVKTP